MTVSVAVAVASRGKYIHFYSPERQQQQVKETPDTTTKKPTKNYAKWSSHILCRQIHLG